MGELLRQYHERAKEVHTYFRFIEHVVGDAGTSNPGLPALLTSAGAMRKGKVDDFRKTLRSGALLVLYNLIEGTVAMALAAIADEMKQDGVTIHEVAPSIQQLVLREQITRLVRDGAAEVVVERAVFDALNALALGRVMKPPRGGFSGNVNASRLRRHASRFGFTFGHEPALHGGEALDGVMVSRNKLAHGVLTFAEVGRDYPVPELVRIETQVTGFLRSYVRAVERYLEAKLFRSEHALREVNGVGPRAFQRLIDRFGSATAVLCASKTDLRTVPGLRSSTIDDIAKLGERLALSPQGA